MITFMFIHELFILNTDIQISFCRELKCLIIERRQALLKCGLSDNVYLLFAFSEMHGANNGYVSQ